MKTLRWLGLLIFVVIVAFAWYFPKWEEKQVTARLAQAARESEIELERKKRERVEVERERVAEEEKQIEALRIKREYAESALKRIEGLPRNAPFARIADICYLEIYRDSAKLNEKLSANCKRAYMALASESIKARQWSMVELNLENARKAGASDKELERPIADLVELLLSLANEAQQALDPEKAAGFLDRARIAGASPEQLAKVEAGQSAAKLAKIERDKNMAEEKIVNAKKAADEERTSAPIDARIQYGIDLREQFLDSGFDIKVSVSGQKAEEIKLEFVLFNDVWAHRFKKDGGMQRLRRMGFKKLTMTDGFNWGYRYTL